MYENIKTIKNSRGEDVAVDLIPEIELQRHKLVEDIISKIISYKKLGEDLSLDIDESIDKYLKFLGKKTRVSNAEELSGNITLTNYSQTKQVKVSINDIIIFDERLNLAKKKIDNCLKRWSQESSNLEQSRFLSTIAMQAFNVDKKGNVNKNQIIRLLKVNIKDKEWIDAQKLIKESMQVFNSRRYKNFRTKNKPEDQWSTISLNFSTF
jgi:hypothetical protein